MAQDDLILDRYEPLGTAGAGGFGTVQIAWDPRIQRKVAIKTIRLTELDAARAALPGAQAVSNVDTSNRWRGAVPWDEYLASQDSADGQVAPRGQAGETAGGEYGRLAEDDDKSAAQAAEAFSSPSEAAMPRRDLKVTSLAHLPGLDEARTAAMLSDPRIVTVYDFEVRGRMAYLIMEYVEGLTLTRLLADYPEFLTLDMVAAVFDSVAGALTAAHDAGVLHLDIKPDNILINTQGQVKVTDFGLATLADASGAGTTGGGTIGYMPLEQMRREHLDARTDEWSLASVAYEMLTGDNPFRAHNLEEAEAAIENAELVLPSLCWEKLDNQIDDVVFYALDPDPEERYASVADFQEEMDKFLGNPKKGIEQLELVVDDALGPEDEEEPWEEEEEDQEPELPTHERGIILARGGLLDKAIALFARDGKGNAAHGDNGLQVPLEDERYDDDRYDEDAYEDDDYEPDDFGNRRGRAAQVGGRGERRMSLLDLVPPRVLDVLSRLFPAFASGFVTLLALSNMQILASGFGPGTQYVIGLAVVVVAVLAAFWAHIGAFVSFSLLGIAIILCGHPVVGAVLLVATVVWWYSVGHEGKAAANVALLLPVAGAVGGSSAVPLVAGAALKPVQALVTVGYALVVAFALATLGSTSLLGWDAPTVWNFIRADVSSNAIVLVKQFSTWATAAGWLASAAAFSFIRTRWPENRLATILALALAVALVLVGSLVFAGPSPQLLISVIVAAAVVLATCR